MLDWILNKQQRIDVDINRLSSKRNRTCTVHMPARLFPVEFRAGRPSQQYGPQPFRYRVTHNTIPFQTDISNIHGLDKTLRFIRLLNPTVSVVRHIHVTSACLLHL